MLLVSAKVGPFRSINTAQAVAIDSEVTVFIGMNEAGKTVFLKALHKSLDAMGNEKFDPVEDYPRKGYLISTILQLTLIIRLRMAHTLFSPIFG